MKIEKLHLRALLALLAGGILYNVWVYIIRPATEENARAMAEWTAGQAAIRTAPPAASTNPATIAVPPPVDLETDPTWVRDPFAVPRETPAPRSDATDAATRIAEPVVRTILFSPQRSVALVDGHIVKVGDRVGDGSVAEISRDAVIVQTPTGEQKRLVLRPPGKQEARK